MCPWTGSKAPRAQDVLSGRFILWLKRGCKGWGLRGTKGRAPEGGAVPAEVPFEQRSEPHSFRESNGRQLRDGATSL